MDRKGFSCCGSAAEVRAPHQSGLHRDMQGDCHGGRARDSVSGFGSPKKVKREGGRRKLENSLRLNAVLEAVELPAGVAGLDAGLADVDGDNLAHSV